MKDYNVIILGTDISCYSLARSYNEAFGKKAIVCAQAVLTPFVDTKIADIYLKEDFATTAKTDDAFVEHLNDIAKKNPAKKNIIFMPYEEYLNKILRNMNKLDFKIELPYPDEEMAYKLFHKSEFYKYLDQIGVRYPKTQVISKDNINSLKLDGDLFMKPDNFEEFENLEDLENMKKGYKLTSKEECISVLNDIYKSSYSSKMIVQEYINGGNGCEYSINGYRAKDGKISMALARNILSDHRDMWVGNHLVQVDYNDNRLYDLAKKMVDSMDYNGLFNFDFKIDSKTGEVYVFEMNIRQGRTFYYSTLAGVNLIEATVNDLVFGKSQEKRTNNKFLLRTLSNKCSKEHIDKTFMNIYEERETNGLNAMENSKDNSLKRQFYVKRSIRNLEKEIYG